MTKDPTPPVCPAEMLREMVQAPFGCDDRFSPGWMYVIHVDDPEEGEYVIDDTGQQWAVDAGCPVSDDAGAHAGYAPWAMRIVGRPPGQSPRRGKPPITVIDDAGDVPPEAWRDLEIAHHLTGVTTIRGFVSPRQQGKRAAIEAATRAAGGFVIAPDDCHPNRFVARRRYEIHPPTLDFHAAHVVDENGARWVAAAGCPMRDNTLRPWANGRPGPEVAAPPAPEPQPERQPSTAELIAGIQALRDAMRNLTLAVDRQTEELRTRGAAAELAEYRDKQK